MQIITSLEGLEAKITECNDALTHGSDDAMRRLFTGFRLDLPGEAPADPFSIEYHAFQMALHEQVTGRPYALDNERTLFNVHEYRGRPFPWYNKSTATAGSHLQAIGLLLSALDLPPGARVVEFGPGWGNTTVALALLGMQVTAVDIEPNFCQVLKERAEREDVSIEIVNADFFWAETVAEPYDAAIFFECFHHCDDHMRLLRALHGAVKRDGAVVLGAEPILEDFPIPWGVRTEHGEALWAMRNFGWLELGFRESYFREALARTGWAATRRDSRDMPHAAVWTLRRSESLPAGPAQPEEPQPAPARPPEPARSAEARALAAELEAMRRSTSWRLTAPLRGLKRLVSDG